VAEKRRNEDAAMRALAQAWHTAKFTMQAMNGKLPSLEAMLKKRLRGPMTIRQQLESVAKLYPAFPMVPHGE